MPWCQTPWTAPSLFETSMRRRSLNGHNMGVSISTPKNHKNPKRQFERKAAYWHASANHVRVSSVSPVSLLHVAPLANKNCWLTSEAGDTGGKYSTPVLWDKEKNTIVNNESMDILSGLFTGAEWGETACHNNCRGFAQRSCAELDKLDKLDKLDSSAQAMSSCSEECSTAS